MMVLIKKASYEERPISGTYSTVPHPDFTTRMIVPE